MQAFFPWMPNFGNQLPLDAAFFPWMPESGHFTLGCSSLPLDGGLRKFAPTGSLLEVIIFQY
jgi:hypothetical protein